MKFPGPMEAIALMTWCFLVPMLVAMGWHCGRVLAALIFGATKSTTDVKIADINLNQRLGQ